MESAHLIKKDNDLGHIFMPYTRSLVLIAYLLFFINCSGEHTFNLKYYQGTYLNKKYLKISKETKSPFAASDSAVFVYYKLKSTEAEPTSPKDELVNRLTQANNYPNAYTFYSMYGFHESDMGVIEQLKKGNDDFYEIVLTDMRYREYPDQFKFYSISNDTFLVYKTIEGGNTIKIDTLIKITSDITQLINKIVLEGDYQTNDGIMLRFFNDGSGF